jgi:hypothetical protein
MANPIPWLRNLEGAPYRAVAILLPIAVLALHVLVMYAVLGLGQAAIVMGLMVAYILPPAGKETVIPLGIALGIPWWGMALAIAMVDIETGLFMALNVDLVYRIPLVGPPPCPFHGEDRRSIWRAIPASPASRSWDLLM